MSTIPISVFAVMTLAEKLADAAAVTIVGMGTVFVSLYVIGEIFTLLHRYFHGRADSDDAEPAPITKAINRTVAQSGIAPHLIPILVAAATVAVGRRVAVRRITFINRNTVSGWAEAGRTSIQSSHNLRRMM